jgi:PAS domain S-box-containing protein
MKPMLLQFVPHATTVGLVILILVIIGNVIVSERNIDRLVENEHRVVHAQKVLTALEEVLSQVTSAETAERGFLITADETYLKSYRDAIERTQDALSRLNDLTAIGLTEQPQVAALEMLVQARFEELRDAIEALRRGGFDAARQSVSTNQGRRLMNEMRSLVRDLQSGQQEALTLRAEESSRSAQITKITDLILGIVGIGMVGVAVVLFRRDLSLRQKADEAIQRLAAIVASSEDSIVSTTLDGYIVSWNQGATRIYSYAPDEAIGQHVSMLCPPERVEEIQQILDRVANGVHVDHFETTRIRKDGRRIDISLTVSPIKDRFDQVIGASMVGRDITERKILQREVLETAAREQRRIGQDLHDDAGQELTGLAMMTERLHEELLRSNAKEAGMASRIVDGLEEVLRRIRDLSRGLVPVEVDAEGLMAALAELAARSSELHAIKCVFICDEPVRILDNATATHLYRLSQEAITNSVKHGHANRITIRLARKGNLISLEITDDGEGFFASSPTVGAGLRIMRYRADIIGAKLTIGPAAERGTRLVCSFTQQPASLER